MPPGQYDAAEPNRGSLSSVRTLAASFTVVLAIAGVSACGGGNGSSSSTAASSTTTAAQSNASASVRPAVGVRRYAIGGDPWAATAAGGDVWVADRNDGTLTRIDGRTGAVRSRVAVAPKPASAIGAVSVAGRVWVGAAAFGKGGDDLAVTRSADARTGKLGPLLPGPTRAAFAFGAGDGAAFVGGFGYLARIPFDGGRRPRSISAKGGCGRSVWPERRYGSACGTLTQGTDSIVGFDARTLRRGARRQRPARSPASYSLGAGAVWVASPPKRAIRWSASIRRPGEGSPTSMAARRQPRWPPTRPACGSSTTSPAPFATSLQLQTRSTKR